MKINKFSKKPLDAIDRTNKDYARYYMKRQKELETLESELAAIKAHLGI